MLSRIWWRTSKLALFFGCVLFTCLLCIYYYDNINDMVAERRVIEQVGKTQRVLVKSLHSHQTAFALKINTSKDYPTTVVQSKTEGDNEGDNKPVSTTASDKEDQPTGRAGQPPDKDSQSQKASVQYKAQDRTAKMDVARPPKPTVDRYSTRPIESSLALPLITGNEYLDERIKQLYVSCKAMISRDTRLAYGNCRNFTNMRFIDGSQLVAMPSFPGSGSTWARSVLEQATGIYTGSVYCDNGLKSKGFAGEKVISTNVLTVKTHLSSMDLFPEAHEFHNPNKFKNVTAVILLIRNPLDSFISLWNWMHGGHIATAAPHTFGNFSKWRKFVNQSTTDFTNLVRFWLEKANISSILVIKYEDMLTDLPTQLRKMLDFLQVPYTDKDIDCVENDKLEHYHRKKAEPFDHYTIADKKFVLQNLRSIDNLLSKYDVSYKDIFNNYQSNKMY